MNISFDAKRAIQNNTGLGNYCRYVIEALINNKDSEYLLFAPQNKENKRLSNIIKGHNNVRFAFPQRGLWKYFSSLWRTWGIWHDIEQQKVQIYHGLSNELPLSIKRCKKVKSIVTIHDLIYLRLPQCYHFFDRYIYNFKYRKSCVNADLIIAVSECTKRDIVELYHINPNKIKVIYQGCDPSFAVVASDERKSEVKNKYQLPNKFVLSVGTIEERKNTLLLVKTLPHLPSDIHVVLVGRSTRYTQQIISWATDNNVIDRLHIVNNVSFPDLPVVYQLCQTFVYPSIYEGFGIPIVEALNSLVPVVAAKGSCLEEAGGPNSLYVNSSDADELFRAISHTFDPNVRAKMIWEGVKWAEQFSQQRLALQTLECYNQLLQG